jgi:hypothetical protein
MKGQLLVAAQGLAFFCCVAELTQFRQQDGIIS